MTREEREVLYKKAVEKWGAEGQLDQLIEEMAELTIAINKVKRAEKFIAQKKDGVMENFYEELADVKLMLEQMEYMFDRQKVDEMLQIKLQKFIKQLND